MHMIGVMARVIASLRRCAPLRTASANCVSARSMSTISFPLTPTFELPEISQTIEAVRRRISAILSPILEPSTSVVPGTETGIFAIKRTYQPSVIRRKRKHGFLVRNASTSGRRVLSRRTLKNRKRVSV